ncbi:arylesterase [Candidatus Kaiserbacteria bacterium]|nr:arylesterase [Candidatus Kaiserbacteria bacterium]
MNKAVFTILTVAVALTAWLLWPTPAPLPPTAGSTVVVFGDSLAAGVGSSAGKDITSRLATSIEPEVINLGVSGDTTSDGLARIDTVIAADPKVVIILLGGNDAIQRVPVEDTFANLEIIIQTIQSTGAAVVLVGEPGGLYSNQYEKEYERLARTYRTYYVPNILSGLIGRAEYMSDLIHPNDAGYKIAADRILLEVEAAL